MAPDDFVAGDQKRTEPPTPASPGCSSALLLYWMAPDDFVAGDQKRTEPPTPASPGCSSALLLYWMAPDDFVPGDQRDDRWQPQLCGVHCFFDGSAVGSVVTHQEGCQWRSGPAAWMTTSAASPTTFGASSNRSDEHWHDAVPGAGEKISYQMPTITLDGTYAGLLRGVEAPPRPVPDTQSRRSPGAGHRSVPSGEGHRALPVPRAHPLRADRADGRAPGQPAAGSEHDPQRPGLSRGR